MVPEHRQQQQQGVAGWAGGWKHAGFTPSRPGVLLFMFAMCSLYFATLPSAPLQASACRGRPAVGYSKLTSRGRGRGRGQHWGQLGSSSLLV